MLKKFFLFSLFLFYFHAFADCGDPKLGQFDCDMDSIRVTYSMENLTNNGWINPNASPSDTFVSGPILNLDPGTGSFKSIQVVGIVKLYNSIFFQGHAPVSCMTAGHIFDVVLSATDASNNTVTLSKYPVTMTNMFKIAGDSAYICTLNNGQGPSDLSFSFIFDFSPNQYRNFQIKLNNLTLNGISTYDSPISWQITDFRQIMYNLDTQNNDNLWYLQLVGTR